jgi:hypothetical protein
VPLYVTARGLTTSPIPSGPRTFQLDFDFIDHVLFLRTSEGVTERLALGGEVADFYRDVMRMLEIQGIDVAINPVPQEIPDPIPFPEDLVHRVYEPDHAARFFRVLSRTDMLMRRHRARFAGRTSPVQFFWGSFDLVVVRYSGRMVEQPSAAGAGREVAEEISAGWWPGDERVREPAFYAYGYPKPPGIERATVEPEGAKWSEANGEFLVAYETVRTADDPEAAVLRFLESTYDAAAALMGFDPRLTT